MRLLIVGVGGGTSIGESFLRAGRREGMDVSFLDMARAYDGPPILKSMWWHLLDRRPYSLKKFSQEVYSRTTSSGVNMVLTTGLAPIDAVTLERLGRAGIIRANFLTDDPWNPALGSEWFAAGLPHYDFVFTPRRANVNDLAGAGCKRVHYLPFGFDEEIFYSDPPKDRRVRDSLESDVFFAGGADHERRPYIESLIDSGLKVLLYGNYWDRYEGTKRHSRGLADPATVRQGLSTTKVGLCLVRRGNRDGNSMRTFEVPAVGACPLVEDTPEHREIFGDDGEFVTYFHGIPEMVEKAKYLVANGAERSRLARECHRHIAGGAHTYGHRIKQMLQVVQSA